MGELGQPHAAAYRGRRRAGARRTREDAGDFVESLGRGVPAPPRSACALNGVDC